METYIDYRGKLTVHHSASLPHWNIEDGVYFVTWRLNDSLPRHCVRKLQRDYRLELEKLERIQDFELRTRLRDGLREEFFRAQYDSLLDEGYGRMWLADPAFATVVEDALHHFDGVRYLLIAWVVMGNHVHVLFRRHPDHRLEKVVGAWKGYTSHVLKPRTDLPSSEPFWQKDYWDRLVRTFEELDDKIMYTLENPRRAGKTQHEWMGYDPDALRTEWPPRGEDAG